jgi:hypothetical protein
MPNQLKPDELFVISALADHLNGTWSAGEDPPDAYLKDEGRVAVEISTLTQHVVDERGGTHARLSEDSTALWLANALDKELCKTIPDGRMVVLTLRAPIANARRTKDKGSLALDAFAPSSPNHPAIIQSAGIIVPRLTQTFFDSIDPKENFGVPSPRWSGDPKSPGTHLRDIGASCPTRRKLEALAVTQSYRGVRALFALSSLLIYSALRGVWRDS